MAATEHKFRPETASRPDGVRKRSASDRPARQQDWREGQGFARTAIGRLLLLPRALVAVRVGRPLRVTLAAV
jgi:hypothetical protein